MQRLRTLVDNGRVVPVVDRVMGLDEVAKAHDAIEAGGLSGKIVIDTE